MAGTNTDELTYDRVMPLSRTSCPHIVSDGGQLSLSEDLLHSSALWLATGSRTGCVGVFFDALTH